MNVLKKIGMKLTKVIPAIALVLGMSTASQACAWWFHQPQIPEQMKKMVK